MLAKQTPELGGGKARRYDYRASGSEGGKGRADQSVNVEQRHHHQTAVVGSQGIMRGDVERRAENVGMSQRHAFRPAGGPAGMQKQRNVVGIGRFRAGTRDPLKFRQLHGAG